MFHCRSCKQDFEEDKRARPKRNLCYECHLKWYRRYNARTAERRHQWGKKYYEKNHEWFRANQRDYYVRTKSRINALNRANSRRLKFNVLLHYSPELKCVGWENKDCPFNCDREHFSDELLLAFLSLDHKNDDGYKHKKEVHVLHGLYGWARANDFPEIFQVLCMNCQWIKRYYHIQELVKNGWGAIGKEKR